MGWKLKCELSDGTCQWFDLKDLKQSNPVDVARYARKVGIDQEPAFKWWIPYNTKKAAAIEKAVISRLRASKTRFGIKIPDSVEECKAFDTENGNEERMKAHNKEIGTIQIAFKILRGKHEIPEGYTKATGFIIYDIKMDFTKKARWVKAGHLTALTGGSRYAGVVSRELVQIVLLYAAMNDLDVTFGDIKSAYLSTPTSEKHYIHLGSEFGEDAGKYALIVRALYGGKHAGGDYWMYLRESMHHLGFESCVSDPDVWY